MIVKLFHIFLVIISVSITLAEKQTISVRIKNGLIDGKRDTFEGKDLNVFLGIPYAVPPIGPLRFKKPLPTSEWSGVLDAKQWPNNCWHNRGHQDYFNTNMSEDCLYLNIWSPSGEHSEETLKPVLFWIHGGALTVGSSAEKFYSGHVLAAKGDIVVVTINYRLNVFGFLYTGTDDAPGNMGIWDQALALEWVNDNIQYFGGDPSQITIAGESAGAFTGSVLILSPFTRHLFKNAILMSGSVASNTGICDKQNLLKEYKLYLQKIDCTHENEQNSDRFSPEEIDCIQNKPVEQLTLPAVGPSTYCLVPILIDGQLLPDSPLTMLENNDFKKNFNLMITTTEDEGSFLLPLGLAGPKFDKHDPPQIDFNTAKTTFENLFKHFFPDIADNIDKVARFYFRGLSKDSSSHDLWKAIGIALGDASLLCPTINFGKKLYEKDPKSNVFQYYFKSKPEGSTDKLFCAKWMGVCHFDDIYPLFGVPFTDVDRYVDKEREVSQEIIEYFSSFVRTGRPSRESSPKWHQFYKIGDKIIAPFKEITDEHKTDTEFGVGLKINECEYIWKKYIAPNL